MKSASAFRLALFASVAFTALPFTAAHAQDAAEASESDGEILVVARKREERLIDVPIAVSAFGQDDLGKLQAQDLSGVQGAVPNLNLVQGRGSSSNANIFIRGIGQPDALQTFDPAVGVYVDGVYMSRIQGALMNLYDVERVEVLRGPQGTLYGKNTIGGAVNIVSRKPHLDDLKASGSFTYGSYDQIVGNAYVSAPLVAGRVALSLAGQLDKRDGIVTDAITGKKYNDRDTLSGRAILRAQATDALEIILSGDYTRQRTALTLGHATAPLVGFNYNATFTAVTPFSIIGAEPYGPYNYKAATSFTGNEGQKLDHWGLSGTINYELGDALTLTSITAYRKLSPDYYVDIDATAAEVGDVFVGVRQKQFSQELQLKYDSDRVKGVFGLYYMKEQIASHQEAYADSYLKYVGLPLAFLRTIDDDQTVKSYAAFGQLTYDLSDAFSVTGGLRYTKDRKEYYRTTTAFTGGAPGAPFVFPNSLPAPFNTLDHVTFGAWTPSLTLSYKPTPNTHLYASAQRGFKSGGFNGRVNGLGDVTEVVNGVTTVTPFFKPETVWTYEAGAKGNFLGGRVRLAANFFYSDYRNFQARVGGGNTGITGGSFPVLNAGKLRMQGVEVEATVKPVTALTLGVAMGYLDAKYKEFNDGRRPPSFSCNPTGTAVVCKPAFAPPISLRLSADYVIPLGSASLTLGGEARFVDKQYLSIDNRPGLTENGYWLGNLYAQADFAEGRYYLRGAVKNVGKSLYKTDGQEFSSVGNIQTVYYGDPRTWSITAGFRF
jgi:iron complex outermembrane receptor protein